MEMIAAGVQVDASTGTRNGLETIAASTSKAQDEADTSSKEAKDTNNKDALGKAQVTTVVAGTGKIVEDLVAALTTVEVQAALATMAEAVDGKDNTSKDNISKDKAMAMDHHNSRHMTDTTSDQHLHHQCLQCHRDSSNAHSKVVERNETTATKPTLTGWMALDGSEIRQPLRPTRPSQNLI